MSANLCPCDHPATEHSSLAGCLAPGCDCERAPVLADDLANLPTQPTQGLAQGRALRDAGAAVVGSTAPGHLVTSWRNRAEASLARAIASGETFSADDLVEEVGLPPRPNMLGALFLHAAKADRINAVGFAPSTRPAARGRVQRTWAGA